MANSDLVRASRDGDQFHYCWAARRCLLLLSPTATLKAISIEGASQAEGSAEGHISIGEELIDVGEYYGDENILRSTLIRYIQIKHSTLRTDLAWTPSELEKTFTGFAERYKALQQRLGIIDLNGKVELWFVSNRPISQDLVDTIQQVAEGIPVRHTATLQKLELFMNLKATALASFCKLLRLEGNQEGLWDQQNLLAQDVSHYLVDADVDSPIQLKELVTQKALSKSAENPSITRLDVLRALKTTESRLFPSPCLIRDLKQVVVREQEKQLLNAIVQANNVPIVIHAESGVGKSVFASRVKLGLPSGSVSILYDCFGNGQYRSTTGYRHRHKDALVQIASELAALGLCHPLIPTPHADSSDYVRAFMYRLRQGITSLRSKDPHALLCIILDAADNAQMAAEEIGEARAFVRDIIREQLPDGVRLVALCRTHRQDLLDPPPSTLRLELTHFCRDETEAHLRNVFPNATYQDIDEFHHLSSHNPRVQALALALKASLHDILRALGPNPTKVEDTIGHLLDASVTRLRDVAGVTEKTQIDRICIGLASLRPLIPLSVLAAISEVDATAIKSFALDLGRPLLITGNSIQFIDEPAETWFRQRFKPRATDLAGFVTTLTPLAATSSYIASTLPQLMLEAGQFAELVTLALSSEALPSTSPLEKRDIELQRLHFALKASLRAKRYTDAAKLALKVGGESAGDERQRKLLQDNTDLAAVFMESERIQELVSRRTFGSGWVGSHHAYEAGLLSGRNELVGDARSRLRMAYEWLHNWSQLPRDERQKEEVSDDDILEIATAHFNIYGATVCAKDLRGWWPRDISFRVGRLLARRFIDHGRFDELDQLALAAGNNLFLVLGITVELREVHRTPPKTAIERALRLVMSPRIKLKEDDHWSREGNTLQALTALVEAAYKLSLATNEVLATLLTRYLPTAPPRGLFSRYGKQRFPLLRAYALRAELLNQTIALIDLAHEELRTELNNSKSHSESRDAREFKEDIGTLLPWHQLWAATLMGRVSSSSNLAKAIVDATTIADKAQAMSYQEWSYTADEIARVWFDTILTLKNPETSMFLAFDNWIARLKQALFTTTLTHLSRLSAHTAPQTARSLDYAGKAFSLIRDAREEADAKSTSYVYLARAILPVSRTEAAAYFDEAVEVASKIGDENLVRWEALLDLANRAASRAHPTPLLAYRLARCAELTYEYVVRDKHFDWDATVEAISGLCRRSVLAILSRWRDRGFGWAGRILPVAIEFLVARGDLTPKTALALIGFRADWNVPLLLQHVMATCADKGDSEAATTFTYRYMTLNQQSVDRWRELKNVVSNKDIALPNLDDRILVVERELHSGKSRNDDSNMHHQAAQASSEERDWNAIFEGVDLTVPNDISKAYRRFRALDPPYYYELFFREAFRRTQVGKEAEFLAAVADVTDFNLYALRNLLEQIPANLRNRLAVKTALTGTVKSFCRRFCMAITRSRYYEILPLRSACELSGISEHELIDVVLLSIAETADVTDARRLFTLVGLLATKLTEQEASDALSFGLDLLEPILKDTDGDGPWVSTLEPPCEIEGSVAGYIWGCLSAPRASLRWEAAHVVRALCTLGQNKMLDHLISLAKGTVTNTFHDARLEFYQLHATQWLLITLARAAREHPKMVSPYADFLTDRAFIGEPHVLIREFAKRTLLALLDAGCLALEKDLRQRLMAVNTSPFPVVSSKLHQRYSKETVDTEGKEDPNNKEDRYFFGIDMGPYWFSSLGHCFAKSENSITREAIRVIRIDWQISEENRWDEDERHRRQIFGRDMETYHSHGSYPRVDDLRFYRSYHAMMMVAGKLLATMPVLHSPDESEDEFRSWIARHDLSRRDGGWLADRRDPTPLERPEWKDTKDTDDWRWSITRNDFDQILLAPGGRINLWGHWTWRSDRREESINVGSALVSPNRSAALLRALQNTGNPSDYRIPDAEDELQIDQGGFQLKGWIVDRSSDWGIDKRDPWAGDIRYPPPEPADYVVRLMKLSSDTERRRWFVQGECTDVAWSSTWGHFSEKDDEETSHDGGSRFQASLGFTVALLTKLKMDLIVSVKIERGRPYNRWERDNDDNTRYIPRSARLFLIKADRTIRSL
jgi:hypothetical protein